jgi:hypothetical protein
MDRLERHAMQTALGITPMNWTDTFESAVFAVPHNKKEDYDE